MTWQKFEQRFSIQLNEQQKQAVQTVEGPSPTGSTGIWQDNGAGNKAWLYDPLQRHRSKANSDRDLYRGGYKGYGSAICGEIWTGTGRAAGISNHQRHLCQSAAILWLSNREDAPSASE